MKYMNQKIKYPTAEEIIETNNMVLKEIDKEEFMKKVKVTIERERDFLERIGRL